MVDKELKIYADYASQPSRAVISFCLLNNIKFTLVETRVGKREHMTEEFIAINPNMQVPAIVEIDKTTGEKWNLFESHAILRYLAKTRNVPDNWYPKDILKRSLVD
jgi:glutathione S-transferase